MAIDFSAYFTEVAETSTIDGIRSAAHPDGRSYTVPNLSAADGLLFTNAIESTSADKDDNDTAAESGWTEFLKDADGNAVTMQRKFLGAALDEMVADGVSQDGVIFITQSLMQKLQNGTDAAQLQINRVVLGEARARANRAERRAASKQKTSRNAAGTKSNRTSGGSPTQRNRTSTSSSSTTAAPKATAKTA